MTWTAAHLTNFQNENAYADVVIYGPAVSTKTTTSTVNTTEETVNLTGTRKTRIVTPNTVTSVVATTTNPDGSTSVNTKQSTVRPSCPITTVLNVGGTPNQKTPPPGRSPARLPRAPRSLDQERFQSSEANHAA